MASLRKNVAGQHFGYQLVDASGNAVTAGGAGNIVIDGGSQTALTGTFTHKGGGQWDYAPTQGETNGTSISFQLTGTSAIPIVIQVFTDNWDTTQAVVTSGTGTNQISLASGRVDLGKTLGTALAGAAGYVGIDWSAINAPTTTISLSGTTIGAVAGAVGSVTGNVGGNVIGTVASVVGAVGSVAGNVGGNVTGTIGGYASGQDPATLVLGATAANWNTAGTIGNKINSAASAGDPWNTALPGSYGAGTAGFILGNNLNATITSRAQAWNTAGGQFAESYSVLHAAPTPAQAFFQLIANAIEKSVNGTSVRYNGVDGSTQVMTGTLNSATVPTSITRSA